jgi:hypothetical protein
MIGIPSPKYNIKITTSTRKKIKPKLQNDFSTGFSHVIRKSTEVEL